MGKTIVTDKGPTAVDDVRCRSILEPWLTPAPERSKLGVQNQLRGAFRTPPFPTIEAARGAEVETRIVAGGSHRTIPAASAQKTSTKKVDSSPLPALFDGHLINHRQNNSRFSN